MRKKAQRDMFRKIAELRQLQLASAEALAERAQSALRREREALDRRQSELGEMEAYWHDAVSRPVLMLEIIPYWRLAVQRQGAQLANARTTVNCADLDSRSAIEALHLAKQNTKTADESARTAAGRYLRSLEEGAVHEMADRYLQQGRKS
jgi:hypothetical protein